MSDFADEMDAAGQDHDLTTGDPKPGMDTKKFYLDRLHLHPITRTMQGVIWKESPNIGLMVLAWCKTHKEPGWVYNDGGFDCPHDLVVAAIPHDLVVAAITEHEPTVGSWEPGA